MLCDTIVVPWRGDAAQVGWLDEVAFVSERDRLNAVSDAKLGDEPRDVGLDGASLTTSSAAISALESPFAISRQTSFAGRELVRPGWRRRVGLPGRVGVDEALEH